MFNKIGIILLTAAILSGCQSMSDQELELLNSCNEKAEQHRLENNKLKLAQKSLIEAVQFLNQQLEQEINSKQVTVVQNTQTGSIKVTLQQAILFSSNSFEIDQEGAAEVLRKVANSIKQSDANLRIIGHTDNLSVAKRWRSKFSDNWDLSSRRAGEVARFLIWGAHFPREKITVAGRADVEPVAGNDTEEGRAKNRRIELFIEK